MELSPELAYKLASVLTTAGEDISTLQPINPFAVDTPKAKRIQATVQSLSPELAATLADNAGGESLAYVALQHQLAQGEDICVSDLPERLQQEVILRNGAELRKEAQARDEAYLQKMESEVGFYESMTNKKTGKKIKFFNLGEKNDWRKSLDINLQKKLEKSFEKEMLELSYL